MGDLISRRAAIEAFNTEIMKRRLSEDTNDDGSLDEFDTESILRALPSAQPGWIPVTERLPEPCEIVLVTLPEHTDEDGERYYKSVICAYYIDFADVYLWFRSDGITFGCLGGCSVNPIAWQPMPTPYREGGQDEQN